MDRRCFLGMVSCLLGSTTLSYGMRQNSSARYSGVLGPITKKELGTTLIHEHIMVDFIGAGESGPHRYQADQVFERALPFLNDLKQAGCETFVDCTPAYLGRDVNILKKLSEKSGLQILTNTGYYGAVNGKYLPEHAHSDTAEELAERWIGEAENGIDGTGILPGFIKIGVNNGPLNEIDRKLVRAAAITHLETGLTISSHTGDGQAAIEQVVILGEEGVAPDAFRWVHAQNEKNMNIHVEVAKQGAWVEFDGIRAETAAEHLKFIENLKKHDLLNRCLISQDSGWYHIGEENGGNFNPYIYLFETFISQLKNERFSQKELDLILRENPANSLRIETRKIN